MAKEKKKKIKMYGCRRWKGEIMKGSFGFIVILQSPFGKQDLLKSHRVGKKNIEID